MTEDVRTELVRRLRELHHFIATTEEGAGTRTTCGNAADEVERLAAERSGTESMLRSQVEQLTHDLETHRRAEAGQREIDAAEFTKLIAELDAATAREAAAVRLAEYRLGIVTTLAAERDRLTARVKELEAERDRLVTACEKLDHEVCQTLSKALGYPWLKDDPVSFPGATEVDGVCVGDHTAESMAAVAVERLAELRERVRELEAALKP